MKRGAVFLGEVLAVALLRVVYLWRRGSTLPKGSKVKRIKNRPVYRFSFPKRGAAKTAKRSRLFWRRRTR